MDNDINMVETPGIRIMIDSAHIEMVIGSNRIGERLNFIIGMLLTLLLLIIVLIVKMFILN